MAIVTATLSGPPRVNLMPRSEIARQQRDSAVRAWMWGVLGAVLVALLIIAGALAIKWLADQRLAAEQAESTALLGELAALAEVSQSLAVESELTEFRSEAMAADFAWSPVLAAITSVLPADASLTGFDVVSGGAPQGADPSLEPGLVGTVSIDSSNPIDIVDVVRDLRGVPGVTYADAQSVTASAVTDGNYSYLLAVEFDQSIYSGAYATSETGDE